MPKGFPQPETNQNRKKHCVYNKKENYQRTKESNNLMEEKCEFPCKVSNKNAKKNFLILP